MILVEGTRRPPLTTVASHGCRYERCRKVILPVCSRLEGHHIDQTFGIMDVTGQ